MKTLKYKIFTIIALTLLASCNQKDDDTSIQEVNSNDITVVELSKTNNFQGDELGIYGMEFAYLNDFTLRNKITKYRYSDGIKDYLNSYALTKEVTDLNTFNKVAFAGLSFEKTNEMMEPQFLKAYRAKNGKGIKEKVQEVSSAMFGKEQTFNLKTSSYKIDESLYIPELITINNVGSFDESINRYRVNKDNLSIEYNTDIKNKNGVALLILWDGTTQDMSIQELGSMNMEYKNKIVVFDPIDSGILNVPQSALSKFPKNANITFNSNTFNEKTTHILYCHNLFIL